MRLKPADPHPPAAGQWTESVRWLHFLPRWSLFVALTAFSLLLVFLFGLGSEASDSALGPGYVELLQAVRSPQMFRFAWSLDALIWLMLGVSLLVFAGLLRQHAPIRAAFIAVCGAAQLFGVLGSFLRLDGIPDLAARYAAAPADLQVIVLEAYLNLGRVINAANHIGVMLQGVGFLLSAAGVFSLRGFPRWLAVWLTLPGILAIAQFALFIAGAPYLFVLNVLGLIGGNIALNLAISIALWRPRSVLLAALAGTNTNARLPQT